MNFAWVLCRWWTESFYLRTNQRSPTEPSDLKWIFKNCGEFFERKFFENHSEWVFVNMVFNIHCFTPFGVRGSLNKLQHSSFILFFTAFGTVSDMGFAYSLTKVIIFCSKNGDFWSKMIILSKKIVLFLSGITNVNF